MKAGNKLKNTTFNDDFFKILKDEDVSIARSILEDWCKAYKDGARGFYLASPVPGRCKTSLMVCVQNYIRFYRRQYALLGNLSEYVDAKKNDRELYNDYRECDVLLFDDIGINNFSGFEGDSLNLALYDLINSRYNDNKTTCFSSNYTLNELAKNKNILPQTVDRIRGMTIGNWIVIKGDSVRELDCIASIEDEAMKTRRQVFKNYSGQEAD